jgi:hypothetical protein
MSYLVPRVYPKTAIVAHFDPPLQVINLSAWKEDLDSDLDPMFWSLRDRKKHAQSRVVSIYFPLYDQFYVSNFDHVGNLSFEQLIEMIYEAGVCAFTYDIHLNPQNYVGNPTPEEIVDEYALMSGDITYLDDGIANRKVYIELQH